MRTFSHIKTSFAILATIAAAFAATPSQAVVVLDTDFQTGYVDGNLQFQQPNGAGNGIWLGQPGPEVDTVSGTLVSQIDSSQSENDGFLRNLWNLGATGGIAGGTSDELGSGFSEGDQIKIDMDYKFVLGAAGANVTFFETGVRRNFATGGFEAGPELGFELAYNPFDTDVTGGSLKIFTNLERLGFLGEDNAFALFVDGIDAGIDPSGVALGGAPDLESDLLQFSYTLELTDESTDTWTATAMSVSNLDTPGLLVDATSKPEALESVVFDGSEMYFGSRWLNSGTPDGSSSIIDSVRYEYIPVPGAAVDGDYNADGVVDAADYTIWRSQQGQVGGGLAADGTGDDGLGIPDGDVDEFDYNFWRANYGASNAASASSAAVPEPSSALLVIVALCSLGLRRRS